MQSIREQWDDFASKCLPADVPEVQWYAMRLAFYSGMHSLLCELLDMSDTQSKEEVEAYIDRIEDELERFHQDLRAGRALKEKP